MILATRVPGRAQCLLDEGLMARARKMGENINDSNPYTGRRTDLLGD